MGKRKLNKKTIFKLVILFGIFIFVVETSGQTKEKKLQKQPVSKGKIVQEKDKIKFVDGKGNVVKEISLRRGEKIITKEIGGKKRRVNVLFTQTLATNRTNKFAAVIESVMENWIPDEEDKKKLGIEVESDITSLGNIDKIIYYDNRGNKLWEKSFKKGMGVNFGVITDDGEYIAITTACIECGFLEDTEPFETVYVYNKKGEELFRFPKERNEYRVSRIESFSSNGRYLAVDGRSGKGETTFFFDLKNNTFWKLSGWNYVSKITNDGVAEIEDSETLKTKVIDLKNYLGN